MLSALHTIKRHPPDISFPVFAHYPAMKLGEDAAVDHYALSLAPLADRMIATDRGGGWVLTSPPVRNLPSGANLLCRRLQAVLHGTRLERLRLVDRTQFVSPGAFREHGDYAKLDYDARRDAQYAVSDVAFDRAALRGRNVIFVNDINVTGSQLRWIEEVLETARPRAIHWLLILNTDTAVGRRFPQLEDDINRSRFAGPGELASFLNEASFRATTKLVSRLLGYGAEGLGCILAALDPARRRGLVRAMFEDGAYSEEFLRTTFDAVI
jgi:PRTase ComF-like